MSPAAASAPIDLAVLESHTSGDRELQGELLGLFEVQCSRLLPCLEAEGDPEAAIAAAHTLKGSAAAVGAQRVVALADALENAFAQADADARPALVASLREAVAEIRAAIGRWREAG